MKCAIFYLSFMFWQDVIIQIRSIEDRKFKALKKCAWNELTTLIQSLKTPNPNFLEVNDFVLHVIYNRPSSEKPLVTRYGILYVEKGKNKIFNVAKSLPPDQHSLNMKMLCTSFVGYSMSSCMQPAYETFGRHLTMVGN